MSWHLTLLSTLCYLTITSPQPLVIKNVTDLGPLHSPDITGVSRDGVTSVLLNGRILWIFDDTECLSVTNQQLSFGSNSASYSSEPNGNLSKLQDFGVVKVGRNSQGQHQYAIRAGDTVGTGGWIPFDRNELEFNGEDPGKDRIAIWPGTNPTPISPVSAFLYAPLVYVDANPQDPSKQYNPRGMTLLSLEARSSGPVAARVVELLFLGNDINWGGFAAVLGAPGSGSTATSNDDRDVYAFGNTNGGLQVARVNLGNIRHRGSYKYFHPDTCLFSSTPPDPKLTDKDQIYLPGSFSSGSVLFSPHFNTFLFIYLDNMADSTFRIRYLDLNDVRCPGEGWVKGGKNGSGVSADDGEAFVRYGWSAEQTLYAAPAGAGGFNYDGFAHPQFFNHQYYPKWVSGRQNDWSGAAILREEDAGGDGKHLLLTWTSQEQGGNYGDGSYYQVMMAKVEFGDPPTNFSSPSATAATAGTEAGVQSTATSHQRPKQSAVGIGNPNAGNPLEALSWKDGRPDGRPCRTIAALAGMWVIAVAFL